jgi:hypothetical protein
MEVFPRESSHPYVVILSKLPMVGGVSGGLKWDSTDPRLTSATLKTRRDSANMEIDVTAFSGAASNLHMGLKSSTENCHLSYLFVN